MEIIKELFVDFFFIVIVPLFFSGLLLTAGVFLIKYLIWLDGKLFPRKNEEE